MIQLRTYRSGLILFFVGFLVLLGLLWPQPVRLSAEVIKQVANSGQEAILAEQLAPLMGQSEANTYVFIGRLRQQLTQYNDQVKAQQKWDQQLSDDYLLSVTKAATVGPLSTTGGAWLWFGLSIGLCTIGALIAILAERHQKPAAINNGIFSNPATNRGWIGWAVGSFLIAFYVVLYFYPEYLTNWILLINPLKQALTGQPASQWFLYGFIYTLTILVMGIRMLIRHRYNAYQQLRTASVMFFQTAFAFLIPEILTLLQQPYQDLKNIWPLDYSFFFDYRINEKLQAGTFGIFMLVWGIILTVVAVPTLTYFYGKRWYCSWVCGCGGLAETAGDPYRQLSDKKLSAWKAERVLVHGVLAFAVIMTGLVLYTYFTGQSALFGVLDSYSLRSAYSFWIGAMFSGVIGTGLYPIFGNRVWCRFGCPLAAYLGLVQRFKSRFRITTNGGQCISCGNCSTYCEMGIDVRWYAQRGQDIVRSSCVGCGICSAVCPRGVLNLETGTVDSRRI
ncbi:4Fe-4S binding protein [Arsenicibacter rosenii]|uniref:FeS-binding protein n=1 Tax=Arsenicibacter rosenii TaxID=1750698 RepID=A0A1S2VJS3_9BACT|nr:4Fe-4S dicluster domain-containing protein [Arsenicibacter rosenii]OIN59012.1 FeS-binding protein [Arsenicibacter rosenii]